eukprot:TRINITY_DN6495_c0_g1_i4.p1 TRINITY_DN6495_c0_g1~~TRINITY_DN6495_c0_g1_i4.p1  ORF type:complete len:115 (-),score=25.65 TRINITY_DN6495_c0_g1_i4:76-420(-)
MCIRDRYQRRVRGSSFRYLASASTEAMTDAAPESTVATNAYIPRKCSATNRLITAKDHASVQINVGRVDENGKYTGKYETIVLCGYIRALGESDAAVNRLARNRKLLNDAVKAN